MQHFSISILSSVVLKQLLFVINYRLAWNELLVWLKIAFMQIQYNFICPANLVISVVISVN